jgi:hypothetical protein
VVPAIAGTLEIIKAAVEGGGASSVGFGMKD